MGNLKNRAKRNKRTAPNWRGIIKMRKPSKKISLKTTFPQNEVIVEDTTIQNLYMDEHNYCTRLDKYQTIPTTKDSFDVDNIEEVEVPLDSTFDFDEWIEVDPDYIEPKYNDANLCCVNEQENEVPPSYTDYDECEIPENRESDWDIHEIIENTSSSFSNNIETYIEVDECCEMNEDESESESAPDSVNLKKDTTDRNENVNANSMHKNDITERVTNDNAQISIKVTGRRIVELNFLINQIKHIDKHSDECRFSDMEVVEETKMGLRTILDFCCSVCGFEQKVTTCDRNTEANVNKSAVLGITSTGSGFYNFEELCAHLDIPCMSDKTFQKNNKELQDDWWQMAKNQADKALKEEIILAKAAGDVDAKGNALIIVITDGSWGKRSYGKGYSSLSGCAVLIGYRTKKIIYVDVKNKYCQYCANSYAMTCPPNDHPCNINYEGASSGMETTIIVEGFKHCATLEARFPIIVADGDASTFKELRELRLYKDPVIIVDKYECVNHLFKNFRKKFKALAFNTKFNSGTRKYITPSKGNEIATGIRMAAKHWREENIGLSEKMSQLEKDCMNAPLHYFGQHDKCDPYYCIKETTPESVERINLLKTDKIFNAILSLCQDYFAGNVKSLLANYNTNVAEGFNGIVAKFLGGKRINYSLAGSYKGRIGMAVVQYNTEYHGGSEFHKEIFEKPSEACKKLENRRKRKLKANAVARQKRPRKKPTFDKEVSQVGYGEGCQTADKTGRAFDLAVESELAKLEENKGERDIILRDTVDRENCAKWHEVRQNIISSFYFPRIINANNPKSYTNLTSEILYNPKEFANTAERKHYKLHEADALNHFTSIYKDYGLEKCGIFIDKELCFLGSTPLRLYGPEAIVAVRCPLKCYNKSVDDAVASNAINFWKRKRGTDELFVNVKSAWYLETQGELHVSDRKFAYLVVWLGEGNFKIEKIERDDNIWNSFIKPKLSFFFKESMLKELANPRRDRKMKLREFDPQLNTFV